MRSYVDPTATPTPEATLADLQPPPDRNSTSPTRPPAVAPIADLISPAFYCWCLLTSQFVIPSVRNVKSGAIASDIIFFGTVLYDVPDSI